MMKYRGTWRANNALTSTSEAYLESNNKEALFRALKHYAKWETYTGNSLTAYVWIADDEREDPILEASGIVR